MRQRSPGSELGHNPLARVWEILTPLVPEDFPLLVEKRDVVGHESFLSSGIRPVPDDDAVDRMGVLQIDLPPRVGAERCVGDRAAAIQPVGIAIDGAIATASI